MRKLEKLRNNLFALYATALLFLSLLLGNKGLNQTRCCFHSVKYVMDLHAIPVGLVLLKKREIIQNVLNVKN
jgi:hypothetical protein